MNHQYARDYRAVVALAVVAGLAVLVVLQGGLMAAPRATPIPVPPDTAVTASMQAAIARELPSWRGIIAEVGGLPDVSAKGTLLFVATTLASTQVDGINDLCAAVAVWAKAAAPSLKSVSVIRGGRALTDCRVG